MTQLYPFQDLEWGEKTAARMFLANRTIIGVFTYMRKQARWKTIGDYPLLSFVCTIANLYHVQFSDLDLKYLFHRSDDPFLKKNIKKLINQLLFA